MASSKEHQKDLKPSAASETASDAAAAQRELTTLSFGCETAITRMAGPRLMLMLTASEALTESDHKLHVPFELVEIIIDFALAEARETKDGTLLCALMHTSSAVRLRLVRGMGKLRLYESDVYWPPQQQTVRMSRDFGDFMWDSLTWYLSDGAERGEKPGLESDSPDYFLTTSGVVLNHMTIKVIVSTDDVKPKEDSPGYARDSAMAQMIVGPEAPRPIACSTPCIIVVRPEAQPVPVKHACTLFDYALGTMLPGAAKYNADHRRPISAFQRALSCDFDAPTTGATFEVVLMLKQTNIDDLEAATNPEEDPFVSANGPEVKRFLKIWRFTTMQTRIQLPEAYSVKPPTVSVPEEEWEESSDDESESDDEDVVGAEEEEEEAQDATTQAASAPH